MTAKTFRLRRTLAAASVALGLIGGLASCTADPEISADASAAYRAQVATIAQHSVAEDYDAALAELDALAAEVDSAVAAGTLDEARAAQIREAIDAVRADLEAAVAAATPTPTAEPEPTEDAGDDAPGNSDGKGDKEDKGKSGKGKGNG
jgi:hypothetical protein